MMNDSDIRLLTATQIMGACISNGEIRRYGGEVVVRRIPETDEQITASLDQEIAIKHYTELAFKIADSLINHNTNTK